MRVKYMGKWVKIHLQNMNKDFMIKIKQISKFKLSLNKWLIAIFIKILQLKQRTI